MFIELIVGAVIGLVLGLTGAGGSVFAVPLLMGLLGLSLSEAAGLSLGAVASSATLGVLLKWRSGQIQWLPALVFATLGSLAVPLGAWLNRQLPETPLLLAFGVLVAVIALRLWRQASRTPEETRVVRASLGDDREGSGPLCVMNAGRPFAIGLPCVMGMSVGALATGVLSGLFGVGGGFLIVPLLLALTQISMRQAVATSLVVIALVSGVGFGNFAWQSGALDGHLLSRLILGGLAGMGLGVLLSRRVSGPLLQKIFAVLMVVVFLVTLLTR